MYNYRKTNTPDECVSQHTPTGIVTPYNTSRDQKAGIF